MYLKSRKLFLYLYNQRISVTQRQSALDALALAERGMDAGQIKEFLEEDKFNSSIYIMLDTLSQSFMTESGVGWLVITSAPSASRV